VTSKEIRDSFLKFFEEHGHRVVPSAPVIPYDDPTLLFTNAGMNQFKDVFLGTGKRDYLRAADSQKCIRVSGKHNDLEEVGRDTYHHTFFEMLGNWSFGDYYKKEAIEWAWELLTKRWGMEKKRLYATVFESDDEAEQLWKKVTDIDPAHVLRFGKKDNFWEMGETGPCGPCSEIHIDFTADYSGGKLVNAGDPRVMEIWNLVFIQYDRDEKGTLTTLPAKHVDTGMGFERICAVLQGKKSNYDTDLFGPIIQRISEIAGKPYQGSVMTDANPQSAIRNPQCEYDVAMRVIADHVRMLTFSIADGGIPSNEGRGYVMRRILRRAARFGRNLGMQEPFIYRVLEAVVKSMGNQYPEIKEKQLHIEQMIKGEEESFNATLDRGLDYFYRNVLGEPIRQAYINQGKIEKSWWFNDFKRLGNICVLMDPTASEEIKIDITVELKRLGITQINGEDAFKLSDTYGFPLDLTQLMAQEIGLTVDTIRFTELMEVQKNRSRTVPLKGVAATGAVGTVSPNVSIPLTGVSATGAVGTITAHIFDVSRAEKDFTFIGYHEFEAEAVVLLSEKNLLVLNITPFYAESGGQVGDQGEIDLEGRLLRVTDTRRNGKLNVHVLETFYEGSLGSSVIARIDKTRRLNIERNHTATHLFHEALRRILGTHAHQQGSLVAPDHLRFDFNHFERITHDQIRAIEDIVNEKIAEDINVYALNDPKEWLTIEEAKKRYPNVKMFFGDKYGDRVRVVEIDPKFSVELCGGTHVKNTRDIGLFKIISESSIASGIRRIEAVTGEGLNSYIQHRLEKIGELDEQLGKLIEEKESLERQVSEFRQVERSSRPSLGKLTVSSATVDREIVERVEIAEEQRRAAIEAAAKTSLELKKELSKHRVREAASGIDAIVIGGVAVDGFKVISARIQVGDAEELKSLGDALRAKMSSGVGVLGAIVDEKVVLVCVVTDDLINERKLQAGKIVGELARRVGGGGGGRPHLATAGGKDVTKLDEALGQAASIVQTMLKG